MTLQKTIHLIIALSLLISGCTGQPIQKNIFPTIIPEDKNSRAYYHFLRGNHAELNNDPATALTAYKQALEYNPDSELLQTKLPLMLIRMGQLDEAIISIETSLQNKPNQKGLQILLANLYTQQGKNTKAITLYSTILEKHPEDTTILLQLGILYLKEEQYKLAEKTFFLVLKKEPKSYYAHLYLAHTYYASGNFKAIEKHYRKALRLNWSSQLCYEMAEFYFKNKFYEKALLFYNQILNYDRSQNQAFFLKIQTLAKLGRYREAYTNLANRRSYSSNPEDIELTIARLLIEQDKTQEAIAILQKLNNQYSTGRPAHALAIIYYNQKKYAAAYEWIDRIPATSNLYDQGILLKLQMYIEEKKYAQAIDLLNTQTEKERIDPDFYNMLASLYMNNGERQFAEKSYLTGLRQYPANESISYDYALFLDREDRIEEALAIMQTVLKNNPDSPQALNFVGYTWADNRMHLEKALSYTTRAAELKPENGYIRDSVGWCYYQLGDFPRAVVELELAVYLAPNDPNIQEHLADAYVANMQFSDAYTTYLLVLKLHKEKYKKERVQQKINALKPQL